MKKIVIAIIVALIIGGVFLWQQKNTQSINSPIEQTVNTPTDTPHSQVSYEPTDTSVPLTISDGIEDMVNKITTALSSGNASGFQNLLVSSDVVLGSESSQSQTVSKADAIAWLNQHWTNTLTYSSKHYVNHFGYWEIATKGWNNTSSGEVDFRLFRYDANGQRQAFSGNWLIYAIVYQ